MNDNEEYDICVICDEVIAPDELSNHLACQHKIHKDCLYRLFVEAGNNSNLCPVCRTAYTNNRIGIDMNVDTVPILRTVNYFSDNTLQDPYNITYNPTTSLSNRLERQLSSMKYLTIINGLGLSTRNRNLLAFPSSNVMVTTLQQEIEHNIRTIEANGGIINTPAFKRFVFKGIYEYYFNIYRRVLYNFLSRSSESAVDPNDISRLNTFMNDNEDEIINVLLSNKSVQAINETLLITMLYKFVTSNKTTNNLENNIRGAFLHITQNRSFTEYKNLITTMIDTFINHFQPRQVTGQDMTYNMLRNITDTDVDGEQVTRYDRNQLNIFYEILMHNDPTDSTLMDLSNEFAHIVGDIHDINELNEDERRQMIQELDNFITREQQRRNNIARERMIRQSSSSSLSSSSSSSQNMDVQTDVSLLDDNNESEPGDSVTNQPRRSPRLQEQYNRNVRTRRNDEENQLGGKRKMRKSYKNPKKNKRKTKRKIKRKNTKKNMSYKNKRDKINKK